MGWFNFGNSQKKDPNKPVAKHAEDLDVQGVREASQTLQTTQAYTDAVHTDAVRERGPWDIDDENAPDYDEYLDFGAFYLPFLQGIALRVKKNRQSGDVLGATVTYGSSSVEIEAFAAPKTFGIWDDVREELLAQNQQATVIDGYFGKEIMLPVKVGEKTVDTRIVGVDGPRWMLRGVFSGASVQQQELSDNEEARVLNNWFSQIVVDRGEEPLAPRDLIPMHNPVTPGERRAAVLESDADNQEVRAQEDRNPYDGPLDSEQQVDVKTTLTRGPMISEVR